MKPGPLKELAKIKGYTLSRAFPNRLILIETRSGKIAGSGDTLEELEVILETLPVSTPEAPIDKKPVEWRVAAPEPLKLVPRCPNRLPGCLCLDDFFYLCPINGCENKTGCWGCDFHAGHLKIFGANFVEISVKKTAELIESEPWQCEDKKHDFGYHSYDRVVERWNSGVRTNVSLKKMIGSSGQRPKINDLLNHIGILGFQIHPVGNGYAVVDGSGNVLAQNNDISLLVKEFMLED